jgi:hypothetical protein
MILTRRDSNYGAKIHTRAGGKSELIGAHVYTGFGGGDKSALFRIQDSSAGFASVREITFTGDGFVNEVMETRGAETRSLPRGKGWFSWTLFSAGNESGSGEK